MGLSGCGSGWGRRVVGMGGVEWWGLVGLRGCVAWVG